MPALKVMRGAIDMVCNSLFPTEVLLIAVLRFERKEDKRRGL